MDSIEVRLLGANDSDVLARVANDVFDGPVNAAWCGEFFSDARHHLAVAIDDGCVVGMVSAIHYVHPDKAPQLWINEVAVASTHRRRGIARRLIDTVLAHGRALGCTEAWLGTEETNEPARALYRAAGGTPEPFTLYLFPLA